MDLRGIGDYIAEDSPKRAITFVQELQTACIELTETPFGFAVLPNFADRGYRRRVHGRYAIIYVVRDDVISVIRVLSAAVDIDAALDV